LSSANRHSKRIITVQGRARINVKRFSSMLRLQ
jgi:hypothetical protein